MRQAVRSEIATDDPRRVSQFLSVLPIPFVPKTAEPVRAMGLRNRCARLDYFSTLASSVTRSTDRISPTKGRGQIVIDVGKVRCRAASRLPSMSKTTLQTTGVKTAKTSFKRFVRFLMETGRMEYEQTEELRQKLK